jgi:hypothetical protein
MKMGNTNRGISERERKEEESIRKLKTKGYYVFRERKGKKEK